MDLRHLVAHVSSKMIVMLTVISLLWWNYLDETLVLQVVAVVTWFWGYHPVYFVVYHLQRWVKIHHLFR